MNIKGQWSKLSKEQKYKLDHFAYIGQTTGNWKLYWSFKQKFLTMNSLN